MKTKFSKLFVTILIVAAVTCCGALGVFAADDTADTAAATTASETVNNDNDHNSSLSIGLVAAALATGLAGIGGGMAVASAAPAAIAANSENEKDLRQEPDFRRSGRVHCSVRSGYLHHDSVQAGVTPCGSFSSAITPTL